MKGDRDILFAQADPVYASCLRDFKYSPFVVIWVGYLAEEVTQVTKEGQVQRP